MDSVITLILHICMLPRVLSLHWMPPCLGLVTRRVACPLQAIVGAMWAGDAGQYSFLGGLLPRGFGVPKGKSGTL